MRQWGGHTLVAGQSVLLLVDDKIKQKDIADDIQSQLQNGKLTISEHGKFVKFYFILQIFLALFSLCILPPSLLMKSDRG
jgi:hypothetical protein